VSEHLSDTNALDVGAQIRNRLIKDLKDDNFVLYFQSIVPLASSAEEPLYREILVRFKEEEQDLMPPGMFIPILEQHGLMPFLDRWVIAQVLKWTRNKQTTLAPRPTPRCSINLSSDTIRRDQAFVDFVLEGIHKMGVAAESLSFEIPVSEVLADPQSLARVIPPLRSAGCSFAFSGFTGEEFGFEFAKTLGITFIKIDGSLIAQIFRDAEVKARVLAIHQRCRKLGMRTVGMQVESGETLDVLRGIQVDYAQGFGVDRPRLLK
jgi:EAL domain-containing protein (putative c-di-GMP-specific phosphodiesterase class I)